jgi:hypothetical protein
MGRDHPVSSGQAALLLFFFDWMHQGKLLFCLVQGMSNGRGNPAFVWIDG